MKVTRTLDVGICIAVLTNEEIFDAISEDTATHDDIDVDVLQDYWLKVEEEGNIIGVVQLKRVFNKCFDCHIHILPEFRRKYSVSAGELILNWCKDNLKGSLLCANVPVFCSNVVDFLLKFGFSKQGILTNAWFKCSDMHDVIILTREV